MGAHIAEIVKVYIHCLKLPQAPQKLCFLGVINSTVAPIIHDER